MSSNLTASAIPSKMLRGTLLGQFGTTGGDNKKSSNRASFPAHEIIIVCVQDIARNAKKMKVDPAYLMIIKSKPDIGRRMEIFVPKGI